MVILFGPVCRVETVVVSDSRLDAGIYQELTDFSFTVLCGHVKRAEAGFVLDRGVSTILNEKFACFVKIFLNCLVEGGILSDFMIFLEIRICTILQQQLHQGHILNLHGILQNLDGSIYLRAVVFVR